MDENKLRNVILDYLDGMRLKIVCVAGIRKFDDKQVEIATAIAQEIIKKTDI